jgi:glutamyl-tRNA synthetase
VPDGLLNYLLLLGWSLDDKTEEFTRDEMLQHFSLERVNKAPASFDPEKLMAFEARAMQRLPIKQRVAKVVPFLQRARLVSEPPPCDTAPYVARILEAAGDRIKVAGDILDFDDFFVDDSAVQYNEQAIDKRLRKAAGARELLQKFRADLAAVEPFTAERLEQLLHTFVEAQGVKPADIVHAIRVAVTGKAVGFGLFDTLAILGRERSLTRIDRAFTLAAT